VNSKVVQAVAAVVQDHDCLVALGGGADSAVLVWAAVEALGSDRVGAVFIYHGLEGSDALRESATSVAAMCGVDFEVIERPIDEGGNLEERARDARYQAIEDMMPPGTIGLTGHTADDQSETVLMRLLRGSGTGALSGIPSRRGVWRRPLLGISRATLRSMAEELALPFSDDPHNSDQRFARAWIRHAVMPILEQQRGPNVRTLIGTSAALLGADDDLLEAEARTVPMYEFLSGVSIPIGPLVSTSDPIASRVVRRALRMLLDGDPGRALDVAAVLDVARGASATTISGSLQVVAEKPFVTILGPEQPEVPDKLDVGVAETLRWGGNKYSIRIAMRPPPAISGGRITVLDAAAVGDGFSIRGFQPGDRIDVTNGSTPVKEVLRVAGVPRRLRPHSPIVTVDGKIAALIGVRVASWARAQRGESGVIIEREVDTWT
jgi:tRNA(Ile)-lysidine synthase